MDPSHLLRRGLDQACVSCEGADGEGCDCALPAKLLDTRTFLPSFCPRSTPTTRFRVPLAERP